jgi:hypothetical protein
MPCTSVISTGSVLYYELAENPGGEMSNLEDFCLAACLSVSALSRKAGVDMKRKASLYRGVETWQIIWTASVNR